MQYITTPFRSSGQPFLSGYVSPRYLIIRFCLAFICLLYVKAGRGQAYNQRSEFIKANSVWVLNTDNPPCSINFNSTPFAFSPASAMSGGGDEGFASVAHPVTGALLFYTNGNVIWNASHNVMLNGSGLFGNSQWNGSWQTSGNGGGSTTQGVCIVPFIHEPGKYYVFSLCGPTSWLLSPGPPPDIFLFYSVVDMSLDGGLGGVVPGQKNIPLGGANSLSESMIAIPGDNCDVWLMVHDYVEPVFRAFHITSTGVDPAPVLSTAGMQIQGAGGQGAYCTGGMAVSPDRQTIGISSSSLVVGASSTTGVLLCRFDPGTGQVDEAVQVDHQLNTYTLAFSQDNNRLYVVNRDPLDIMGPAPLLQYTIGVHDSATIAASRTLVSMAPPPCAYLRLYNDKIYAISPFLMSDSLWIIEQPDLTGAACNFHYSGISLGATLSSLPAEVVYAFPADTTHSQQSTTVCLRNGHMVETTLTAPAGYSAYAWNDGSTGATLNIDQAGTYWVLCKDSCHSLTDTFTILPGADISLELGNDTLLCKGNAITLQVTVPGASYRWQDGNASDRYTITDGGRYWVSITKESCTASDTLNVNLTDVRQALGDDIVLCREEAIHAPMLLQANAPAGAQILWSDGSSTPTLSVSDTGIFWVQVTEGPCTGSDTLKITEQLCTCGISMPNAFSPNGDGLNDLLRPMIAGGCAIRNYVFNIYNRYGERIYSSADPARSWNGNYPNGQPADAGTYMYELSFLGGSKQVKYHRRGDITLLR